MIHVLKSLTYFSDAETDPMPHMLTTLDWEKVKQFFLIEALVCSDIKVRVRSEFLETITHSGLVFEGPFLFGKSSDSI